MPGGAAMSDKGRVAELEAKVAVLEAYNRELEGRRLVAIREATEELMQGRAELAELASEESETIARLRSAYAQSALDGLRIVELEAQLEASKAMILELSSRVADLEEPAPAE